MYPLVDDLIKGRLSKKQVDELWAEMLANQDLFAYYRTQVGLTVELKNLNYKRAPKPIPKRWWFAATAALLLITSLSFYLVNTSIQKEKRNTFIAFNAYDLESFDTYRSNEADDSTFNSKVTQATTSLLLGDIDNAIEMYNNLISKEGLDPEVNAVLHFNRALVYYAKKDYQVSFTDLNKSLALTENTELINKINYQLVKVLVAQKKAKEAKTLAQKCLESNLTLTKSQRAFIEKIAS